MPNPTAKPVSPVVPPTTNKFETSWNLCAIVTILDGGFETRVALCPETFAQCAEYSLRLVSIFHAQKKAAFAATKENTSE
jgi:hypothetical protein